MNLQRLETVGTAIMAGAIALAVAGLALSTPLSTMPVNPTLVGVLLEGYHIDLIRTVGGNGYLISMASGEWLAICASLLVVGAAFARVGGARFRPD